MKILPDFLSKTGFGKCRGIFADTELKFFLDVVPNAIFGTRLSAPVFFRFHDLHLLIDPLNYRVARVAFYPHIPRVTDCVGFGVALKVTVHGTV